MQACRIMSMALGLFLFSVLWVSPEVSAQTPNAASFLRTDTTTQGNWHGTYGADGYSVAEDSQSLPSYASFALQNQLDYTWLTNTADPRALQTGSGSGRIAATWYNPSSFSADVNFADGNTHQLALYTVDWDNQGRSETVQILDASTAAVLDTRSISSFTGGAYLVWNISGHVTVNVTQNSGPNAVVSGVFFGGSSPINSAAAFLRSDTATEGNWHGAYGADGYSLAGDLQSIPAYASFAVRNQSNFTWAASTGDPRALESGSGTGRLAATWYNGASFSFDVNVTDGNPHQFALYAIDWDSLGRSEVVQVLDAATDAVLDTESTSNFTNGVYLVWNISGHVTINVIVTAGPNAVVSGVFFGGSSTITSTAAFVKADAATQGNWQGTYGADGYSEASSAQSFPSYASFAVQNEANWTWDANPTDPRALEMGSGSGRIAATWYNNPTFNFDVNLTDGNTHQVSLYAVDYDSQGRAETIQVLDSATEALLDTETLPAFTNGVYLVWNISGHVRINVIGTSGPNAVVSGVFFDPPSGGTQAPILTSITVTPANPSIAAGTPQQFTATGTYSDGSTQNLTSTATWSSSLPSVATISTAGLATAVVQGQTTIQAAVGAINGSATLTVTSGAAAGFTATGSPNTGRSQHTATLLNNAMVLIAGGLDANGNILTSAELYDPTTGCFAPTGSLTLPRQGHTATLLNNGMVLIAGGRTSGVNETATAELYDPTTGTFTATGSMNTVRFDQTATLLNNGTVLIAGGFDNNSNILASAELYDPVAGTFSITGPMNTARFSHTATPLNSGMVLIAGGTDVIYNGSKSAELYDPVAGTFAVTGSLNTGRGSHTATLLNNGMVLIAGGFYSGYNVIPNAELYNPTSGVFTYTGSPNTARDGYTATLLNDGMVLIAGGYDRNFNNLSSVEMYDPTAGAFSAAGSLVTALYAQTATLLTNGTVLIAGGFNGPLVTSAELYEPSTLTPAGLVSIAVSPLNPSVPVATAQGFTAVGTFGDGSTQTLASATWNSSNNAIAMITNDSTNYGHAFAVAASSATVSACAGSVCGSTAMTVSPSALAFITITPASGTITMGSSLQLQATGIFADGDTEDLTSFVTWTSSAPSVATINPTGLVNAVASGSMMITASLGGTTATTTLTVPTPSVSIAVAPQNPSVPQGNTQQFTATGTYADGSTQDLTASVSWTSSNTSVVMISNVMHAQGFADGISTGTATITATLAGAIASTTFTVVPAVAAPNPPTIASVTPTSGAAATQVTITGSGFGTAQNGGSVYVGTAFGIVQSWSDTQIVATVAPNSTSGSVQVLQSGQQSNSINFTVYSPTIASIDPTSGLAGTSVTITGSGFGAAQGSGQVSLGSTSGIVTSWTDGQIVATVGAAAASGSAQVLQNGAWSNAVPFTINTPHITSVTPTSGGSGTSVTIVGSGFGAAQGSGQAWLGSTNGVVTGWSDAQVIATVASGSLSGIVRIQQDGVWSNAVSFTVPSFDGSAPLTIAPNMISMVVGDTHTIEAVSAQGQSVTGLTWTSSDTTVVSLSTDDPPILTAVAAGHVTITAGNASADVTVYAGTLPAGTVLWSNSGDGSGIQRIVPAVPSASGVDVFAFDASNNVTAVRADGTTAWTASLNGGTGIPDFQGGLVDVYGGSGGSGGFIQELDGATGQPHPAYTSSNSLSPVAVGTDGTIFTQDGNSVVGIDPATGAAKFSVPLEYGSYTSYQGNAPCQGGIGSNVPAPSSISNLIVAGDGNAYAFYSYENTTDGDIGDCIPGTDEYDLHLRILRVAPDGSSSKIPIGDWTEIDSDAYTYSDQNGFDWPGVTLVQSGSVPNTYGISAIITNADQGVLVSWTASLNGYCASSYYPLQSQVQFAPSPVITGCVPGTTINQLTAISGGGAGSSASTQVQLQPILQRADGTFIGNVWGVGMGAFDQSGNILWTVPNYSPVMATADGGVIATGSNSNGGLVTATFDANGNATGQNPSFGNSINWEGNAYYSASGAGVVASSGTPPDLAPSYAAILGGNQSGQGTAIDQVQTNQTQGSDEQLPPTGATLNTNYNSIELLTSLTPTQIFSQYIQTFAGAQPGNNNIATVPANTNVTASGQTLTFTLHGPTSLFRGPFAVQTERFDPSADTISAVTLQGHPLEGWRYWRAFSIGTNDVVIETGAADLPGPGRKNYWGYFIFAFDQIEMWHQYLEYIKNKVGAPQGSNFQYNLVQGEWGYRSQDYILNNVCQASWCN